MTISLVESFQPIAIIPTQSSCRPFTSNSEYAKTATTSKRRSRMQQQHVNIINPYQSTQSSLSSSSSSSSNDDFIDYILSPPSDDPSFRCTHMVGIPLEQNHDLLLELESIQRAVLYHCPLLIHSCIAPIVTRMPLLLVDTNPGANTKDSSSGSGSRKGIDFNAMFNRKSATDDSNSNNNNELFPSAPGENDLLTSRDPITRTIHDIVNAVVNEMINVESKSIQNETDENRGNNIEQDNTNDNDNDDEREGINRDNIKPLLLKFKGLEIDGDLNEILHAVGTEDSGTIHLRNVLNEITKRIEQKGWKAYIPEDNPQGKVGGLNEDGVTWRPRIPFMRLPNDFFETLPNPIELYNGKKWDDCSEDERMNYMRLPDEGGNGISPLFWFKWMDDPLCNGKSIR